MGEFIQVAEKLRDQGYASVRITKQDPIMKMIDRGQIDTKKGSPVYNFIGNLVNKIKQAHERLDKTGEQESLWLQVDKYPGRDTVLKWIGFEHKKPKIEESRFYWHHSASYMPTVGLNEEVYNMYLNLDHEHPKTFWVVPRSHLRVLQRGLTKHNDFLLPIYKASPEFVEENKIVDLGKKHDVPPGYMFIVNDGLIKMEQFRKNEKSLILQATFATPIENLQF